MQVREIKGHEPNQAPRTGRNLRKEFEIQARKEHRKKLERSGLSPCEVYEQMSSFDVSLVGLHAILENKPMTDLQLSTKEKGPTLRMNMCGS